MPRPLRQPRVVAVSKTKPATAIAALHEVGQRHFGENYVQELLEKVTSCPPDVAWHFIGQLQSNKAKALVLGTPSLWAVESVDSEKLANILEKAVKESKREPLRVFVQVNTSGETQKGGVEPGAAAALAAHIVEKCPNLKLAGLMTIGKLDEMAAVFFERLLAERTAVEAALVNVAGTPPTLPLELSMGMSGDFEMAMEHGSTNIRLGSSIFGARGKAPLLASAT